MINSNLLKNDRAVSPVIGVILMVAITVILAAVIGTFVLTMGDDVDREISAGTSFNSDSESATVQWTSEGNADQINVTYRVVSENDDFDDLQIGGLSSTNTDNAGPNSISIDNVGERGTISVSNDAEGGEINEVDIRITVVGENEDGVATTLRTESVTLEIPIDE